MTKEELAYLAEEIEDAREYLHSGALGEDEWAEVYVQFEDLLNAAEVLMEVCVATARSDE